MSVLLPESNFRIMEPTELWSSRIQPNVRLHQFIKIALAVAEQEQQRYTGFIATSEEGVVNSFTRMRYPRKKYGIATISDCQKGLQILASNFSVPIEPDPQQSGFRVMLELIEGYGSRNPRHTAEEVIRALGSSYEVTDASLFIASPTPLGSIYSRETAAIIRGPISEVHKVFELADRFRQERFAVEDFDRQQAYMVETRHCREPDT